MIIESQSIYLNLPRDNLCIKPLHDFNAILHHPPHTIANTTIMNIIILTQDVRPDQSLRRPPQHRHRKVSRNTHACADAKRNAIPQHLRRARQPALGHELARLREYSRVMVQHVRPEADARAGGKRWEAGDVEAFRADDAGEAGRVGHGEAQGFFDDGGEVGEGLAVEGGGVVEQLVSGAGVPGEMKCVKGGGFGIVSGDSFRRVVPSTLILPFSPRD